MTNAEKNFGKVMHFAAEIMNTFGVDKNGKMQSCKSIHCSECILNDKSKICAEKRMEWLKDEYVELSVDWSKVPVDTKILVAEYQDEEWYKVHFAKYENGNVYAWINGETSYTTDIIEYWEYAKLAEE